MPTCKCKMCGGQIKFDENETTAICEFCGTEQTVVFTDDLNKASLFNRANSLRLSNDFDGALQTYESILIDNPKDAEAHWGVCLSRYGIEYVTDPLSNKKIPTCHRTLFNSILDDINFMEAISNCDVLSRKIYQQQADEIDKIQKNILALSQKEDPYDIFICYKETDENGQRTKDSVISQEIYDALIKQGYRVFFSRITLESKLGSEYEPVIFSALRSSKVMLVVGSKEEYFNSAWVKNEWSRYLSFMNNQKDKYLIPCYKDMEAYEMPKEFLSLQSQSIDKLGFLQDLINVINRLFGKEIKEELDKNISNNNIVIDKNENLLIRIKLFIEDKEYSKAEDLIEKVLKDNAQCAEAYFDLMLIDLRLTSEADLLSYNHKIDQNKNYQKALRFADDEFKEKLISYNENIFEVKLDDSKIEEIYKENKLKVQRILFSKKPNDLNFSLAIDELKKIENYKDTKVLIEKFLEEYINLKKNYNPNAVVKKQTSSFTGPKETEIFKISSGTFAATFYLNNYYEKSAYNNYQQLSKKIKICSRILHIDTILLLILGVVFLFNNFNIISFFIGIIAFLVGIVVFIIYDITRNRLSKFKFDYIMYDLKRTNLINITYSNKQTGTISYEINGNRTQISVYRGYNSHANSRYWK